MGEGKPIAVTFAQQRAARIVAALLVGAALGLSGSIFQVISGNALGSPDIIGFTNGAATGALLQIIVFNSGPVEVALGAVIGGLATSILVWLMTRNTGLHGFRLVLVGIGVGSTLAAFNALLVVRASLTQAQTAASWLAGSLNDMTWERTYSLLGLLLVVTPLLLMLVRPLYWCAFGLIGDRDDRPYCLRGFGRAAYCEEPGAHRRGGFYLLGIDGGAHGARV